MFFWLFVRRLTWDIRRPVRPCAVWTGRPRDPRLAGGIKPEQCDPAILSERETIQIHAANRNIAADNDCRSCSRVISRNRNCVVQFNRLAESSFRVVFLRGFAHEAGVDYEQISASVVLK